MGNNLDCSCAQRKETEKEVYYTNREISLNVNEFMPCKVRTIKLMEKVIVDTTVQNEVDVGDDYNDEEELMKDEEEGEGEDREGMVVKAGRKRSVNISGNEEELNNDEEKCSDEKEHCDDVNVNNESHMKNDNDNNNNNKDDNNVNINNEMNSNNDNNACIDNDNINININEMNKITEETPNSPINKIETPVDNDNDNNNNENNTPITEEAPIKEETPINNYIIINNEVPVNNENTDNINNTNNNEQHKENISNINISNIAINDDPLHNENELSSINKPTNILQHSPIVSENLQNNNNNITNNDDQVNNSIPKLRFESDDLTLGLLLNSIDHQEEDQTEHLEATIHPPLTPLKHQPNRARSSSVDVITLNEDKLTRITKQINSLMQQAQRKPSISSLIQKQQSTTSNKPQTSRNNKHFNTHSHLHNSKHSQQQRSRTSRQSFTFHQHHFTCNKKRNCNCHLLYPSTGSGASLEKRINGQIINTSHSEAPLTNI